MALLFSKALSVRTESFRTSVISGWKTTYTHWRHNGSLIPLSLQTSYGLEHSTGRLFTEITPLFEEDDIASVCWPPPFEWQDRQEGVYTVLPMMQGCLIPNDWEHEVTPIRPVMFYDRAGYMPWIGFINKGHGCLQILETSWDCGYELHHPAGGPTHFNYRWKASLGAISYKRIVRMEFFSNCDYNTLCKSYRRYVKEKGRLITLEQKALSNEKISKLAGSPVIHSCISYHVNPEAYIYDADNPEENNKFNTFRERQEQLKQLHERGLKKAYFHFDGWGVDGYDQQHPDILPPCEEAGGAKAMKELQDACKDWDILFALHDQYRDYYLNAQSYDSQNAIHGKEHCVLGECTWNGGEQTYLCTSLAEDYVRRNYIGLERLGLFPDGVYLDVFSIVPLDECRHIEHKMTRRECAEYRANCCEFLRARGIVVSSEEAADHLLPHMELCHHAHHAAVPTGNGKDVSTRGIPVPLLNLVYHDCLLTPWHIDDAENGKINGRSRKLMALLNGGMPYLSITANLTQQSDAQEVCDFHEKIAFCEMVKHEFVDNNPQVERTYFKNGISITIDFKNNMYKVEE